MYKEIVVCIWLGLVVGIVQGTDYVYANNVTLSSGYRVYWTVKDDYLQLGLDVPTKGWIGFGIGESNSGSMPGADFVIIELDAQSKPVISDRYSEFYDEPIVDSCQDWKLQEYQMKPTSTVVHLQRKLFTNDSQDRIISPGETKILWAYGDNNRPKIHYHSIRRGVSQITFIPPIKPVPSLDGTFSVDIRMPDVTLPARKTTYMCYPTKIDLPDPSKDYHIVQIDPFVQAENTDIVHHLVVHICYATDPQNASVCEDLKRNCYGLLYGWAMGGGPLVFPEVAGIRVGADQDKVNYLILEIHYTNPSLSAGIVDSSGIVLHLTEHLRQYDAGNLVIGNIGADEVTIPANTSYYRIEAECPSLCTSMFPHPIHVFSSMLHMHNVGSMSWSTQHRQGQRLPNYLDRVEYFGFEFQGLSRLERVIEPGDRLNLICIYNTLGKPETKFGSASDNEMCMEFLSYYPKLNMIGKRSSYLCGSVHFRAFIDPNGSGQLIPAMTAESRNYSTLCWDSFEFDKDNFTVGNPIISDFNVSDNYRKFGIPKKQCPYVNDSSDNELPLVTSSDKFLLEIALGIAAGFVILVMIGYALSQSKSQPKYQSVSVTELEIDQ